MAADIIEEWVEVTGVGLGRGIKGQVGWGWGIEIVRVMERWKEGGGVEMKRRKSKKSE